MKEDNKDEYLFDFLISENRYIYSLSKAIEDSIDYLVSNNSGNLPKSYVGELQKTDLLLQTLNDLYKFLHEIRGSSCNRNTLISASKVMQLQSGKNRLINILSGSDICNNSNANNPTFF